MNTIADNNNSGKQKLYQTLLEIEIKTIYIVILQGATYIRMDSVTSGMSDVSILTQGTSRTISTEVSDLDDSYSVCPSVHYPKMKAMVQRQLSFKSHLSSEADELDLFLCQHGVHGITEENLMQFSDTSGCESLSPGICPFTGQSLYNVPSRDGNSGETTIFTSSPSATEHINSFDYATVLPEDSGNTLAESTVDADDSIYIPMTDQEDSGGLTNLPDNATYNNDAPVCQGPTNVPNSDTSHSTSATLSNDSTIENGSPIGYDGSQFYNKCDPNVKVDITKTPTSKLYANEGGDNKDENCPSGPGGQTQELVNTGNTECVFVLNDGYVNQCIVDNNFNEQFEQT